MTELSLHRAVLAPGEAAHAADAPLALRVEFAVESAVVFDVDVSVEVLRRHDDSQVWRRQLRADGWDPSWLPRGAYRCHLLAPRLDLPAGEYTLHVALWHQVGAETRKAGAIALPLDVRGDGSGEGPSASWQLESQPGTMPIDRLSWRRGAGDWFYKHFDHAARTVASYMLGDSALLKGRILDVGCGDGVTDLGIALRHRPERFVGIDPFRGYEKMPGMLERAGLPADCMPDTLEFLPADGNAIPFPDDSFDVVLSWGSLEHIVGGYLQTMREIRRVLRPGGLFFVHPGLYYSDIGNHLGEFAFAQDEPYVHLKRSHEELREMVLGGTLRYIDRSGEFATPQQYWQWYCELNPIRIAEFEQTLRGMGFEPWRVAVRTHDRVDYTPELQPYSFTDLAVGELYVSAWNRK